jgi:hypothetical protein
LHHVAADEGLAAGDADAFYALADECRTEPFEFLEGQQLLPRQERHVLRHAIDATEIAPVGHRNAEIGNSAAEWVDHEFSVARSAAKI